MKLQSKFFLFLVVSVFLFSCSQKNINEKNILVNYLSKTFNLSLEENHFYILIPNIGCKYCNTKASYMLKDVIANFDNNRQMEFTVISTDSTFITFDLRCNELIDKKGIINRLNIDMGNVLIVRNSYEEGMTLLRITEKTSIYQLESFLKSFSLKNQN